jgi:hypothetical protein
MGHSIRLYPSRDTADELVMRRCIFIGVVLVLSVCDLLWARDRVLPPRSISMSFAGGEKVTFELIGRKVTAITMSAGATTSSVPPDVCARLRDIRFETVQLGWNGSYKTVVEADYYSVSFNMGPKINRPNGDFPPVNLMFRDGKFSGANGIL